MFRTKLSTRLTRRVSVLVIACALLIALAGCASGQSNQITLGHILNKEPSEIAEVLGGYTIVDDGEVFASSERPATAMKDSGSRILLQLPSEKVDNALGAYLLQICDTKSYSIGIGELSGDKEVGGCQYSVILKSSDPALKDASGFAKKIKAVVGDTKHILSVQVDERVFQAFWTDGSFEGCASTDYADDHAILEVFVGTGMGSSALSKVKPASFDRSDVDIFLNEMGIEEGEYVLE